MYALLSKLGFTANPFGSYVAEKEPNLEKYIVRPAYYQTISERTTRSESFILFGARGAGKSATRIALYKECWNRIQDGKLAPLAVNFDSFAGLLANGSKALSLSAYVRELAFLTVEAILVWLTALKEADREKYTEAMTADEERLAVSLVQTFYLSAPELTRKVSATRALQLLDQAWHERTVMWVQKKWDGLSSLLSSIAGAIVKKRTGIEGEFEDPLKLVLARSKTEIQADQVRFSLELLNRLVEFVRMFGFSGIVVLIDKVDETEQTNDSAEATASLLYPLLSNTMLLETDGLGWLFFVWNKVRAHYGPGHMPVRLDKIANAEIAWDRQYLIELVNHRLKYFSEEGISDVASVFLTAEGAEPSLKLILSMSMNSPRELIRIFDTVLREHDEHDPSVAADLLSQESVERGLDKYAREFVENNFSSVTAQQFLRLDKIEFTNHDVQTAFRINDASARNKIRNWSDAGLVVQTGTRPSGEAGGKPAHQFGIADERLRRVVTNRLTSLSAFDLETEDSDRQVRLPSDG